MCGNTHARTTLRRKSCSKRRMSASVRAECTQVWCFQIRSARLVGSGCQTEGLLQLIVFESLAIDFASIAQTVTCQRFRRFTTVRFVRSAMISNVLSNASISELLVLEEQVPLWPNN